MRGLCRTRPSRRHPPPPMERTESAERGRSCASNQLHESAEAPGGKHEPLADPDGPLCRVIYSRFGSISMVTALPHPAATGAPSARRIAKPRPNPEPGASVEVAGLMSADGPRSCADRARVFCRRERPAAGDHVRRHGARDAGDKLAAALSGGCSVYLTSDRALPRIPGLEILQVSDYAGAP